MSFDNISTKWVPEIRKYCPNAPILLVGMNFFHFLGNILILGTKLDLRDDPETIRNLQAEGKSPVTKSHGQKCANRIKAVKYLECSALTQHGLSDVSFCAKDLYITMFRFLMKLFAQ